MLRVFSLFASKKSPKMTRTDSVQCMKSSGIALTVWRKFFQANVITVKILLHSVSCGNCKRMMFNAVPSLCSLFLVSFSGIGSLFFFVNVHGVKSVKFLFDLVVWLTFSLSNYLIFAAGRFHKMRQMYCVYL